MGENEIKPLIAMLCLCLEDLHNQNLIHTNLHPNNILIDSSGRPRVQGQAYSLKEMTHWSKILKKQLKHEFAILANFGQKSGNSGQKSMNLSAEELNKLKFRAPELREADFGLGEIFVDYWFLVDIWSLGMVSLFLLLPSVFASLDWVDLGASIASIDWQRLGSVHSNISPQAFNFIEICLQIDPRRRISSEQVKKHPFFEGKPKIPKTQFFDF